MTMAGQGLLVRLALASALAAPGCVEPLAITAPTPPPGTGTLVVRFPGVAALWVIDPTQPPPAPPPLAVPMGLEAVAYALPQRPQALQVVPGFYPRPSDTPRQLPPALWSASGRAVGGALTWRDDASPQPTPELPLPPFEWGACVAQGGCGPARPWSHEECNSPCATPELPTATQGPLPPTGGAWRWDTADGPTLTATAAVVCPDDTRQPVGAAGCAPLGPCAADWPTAPDGVDPVVYVDPAAPPGGDGTSARPLRGVVEGLAAAAPAGAVLLRAGVHTVPSPLRAARQQVVGTCAARTRLTPSDPAAPVALSAEALTLADLTLPSVELSAGALSLARVRGTAGPGPALRLRPGAALDARSLLVRGGGEAVVAEGATLSLEDVVLEDLEGSGLTLFSSTAEVRGLAARRLRGSPTWPDAKGIWLGNSTVELRQVELVDGVFPITLEDHAEVFMQDVVVTGTREAWSIALKASGSVKLTLREALFYDLHGQTMELHAGSSATVTDLVVVENRGVRFRATFFVGDGASLLVNRAFIREPEQAVLRTARDDTVRVELNDLRIIALHPADERATVLLAESGGLVVRRSKLTVASSDALDVRKSEGPVHLEDLEIEGGKIGLTFEPTVSIRGRRLRLWGQSQVGILFGGIGAFVDEADLMDAVIGGVVDGPGIQIPRPGLLSLERFVIADCARGAGIEAGAGASVRLKRGELRGNRVGVALDPDADTPLTELVEEVRYRDNGQDFTR
jgi:hypothetical protein